MNKKKQLHNKITQQDSHMLWSYLIYTFGIAWGTELLLIAIFNFNLLSESIELILYFTVIGFGAGMAPAYAAFFVQRSHNGITFKVFCRQIFHTPYVRRSIGYLFVFAIIQFVACVVQESYLGNPWYLFILFMPMMIFGGGLEEIGWRGVFQPLLEKRFPFLAAVLIEGIIWSVWHLPLWFLPNSTQRDMNFTSFTLYTIILGLTLAAAYRLTKCIWVTILIHAWGNTVLGGMYTLTSLNNNLNIKTLIVYGIQAAIIMLLLTYHKNNKNISAGS
ncbi:MAG: type II CAAX endopeptidase family protein [Eubacteriales bacterium]|nr:type II CAAX endopeptidase family protein [Eubacteriales bacterium]